MAVEPQTLEGIPNRRLIGMLAQAMLEDWPPHTRVAHVLANAGIDVRTDLTIQELARAA